MSSARTYPEYVVACSCCRLQPVFSHLSQQHGSSRRRALFRRHIGQDSSIVKGHVRLLPSLLQQIRYYVLNRVNVSVCRQSTQAMVDLRRFDAIQLMNGGRL